MARTVLLTQRSLTKADVCVRRDNVKLSSLYLITCEDRMEIYTEPLPSLSQPSVVETSNPRSNQTDRVTWHNRQHTTLNFSKPYTYHSRHDESPTCGNVGITSLETSTGVQLRILKSLRLKDYATAAAEGFNESIRLILLRCESFIYCRERTWDKVMNLVVT